MLSFQQTWLGVHSPKAAILPMQHGLVPRHTRAWERGYYIVSSSDLCKFRPTTWNIFRRLCQVVDDSANNRQGADNTVKVISQHRHQIYMCMCMPTYWITSKYLATLIVWHPSAESSQTTSYIQRGDSQILTFISMYLWYFALHM
jgi:hypothetical protein